MQRVLPVGHTGLVCKFWRNLNLSNVLGHFFIWSIDIILLLFLVTVLEYSLYIGCLSVVNGMANLIVLVAEMSAAFF